MSEVDVYWTVAVIYLFMSFISKRDFKLALTFCSHNVNVNQRRIAFEKTTLNNMFSKFYPTQFPLGLHLIARRKEAQALQGRLGFSFQFQTGYVRLGR